MDGILKDEKEKARKTMDMLDNTNICFTYDKDSTSPKSVPIYAINRNDCHSKYTMIGYKNQVVFGILHVLRMMTVPFISKIKIIKMSLENVYGGLVNFH